MSANGRLWSRQASAARACTDFARSTPNLASALGGPAADSQARLRDCGPPPLSRRQDAVSMLCSLKNLSNNLSVFSAIPCAEGRNWITAGRWKHDCCACPANRPAFAYPLLLGLALDSFDVNSSPTLAHKPMHPMHKGHSGLPLTPTKASNPQHLVPDIFLEVLCIGSTVLGAA